MFYSQRTYVKNDVTKVTVFSHRVEGGQQLCLVDVVGELQLEFGLVLGVVSHFPGLSGMTVNYRRRHLSSAIKEQSKLPSCTTMSNISATVIATLS
jgi:hypothetical protein